MAKRAEKPFDKIMLTKQKLSLYNEYGEVALMGQPMADFFADVDDCFQMLLTFRNMVNSMVALNERPEDAVRMHLPDAE